MSSESQPLPDLLTDSPPRGSLEALYGPIVVDHIAHPRNLGVLEAPSAIGTVDDVETENLIIIYVRVERDRVVAVSFRALACSACIAASSMATVLLSGHGLTDSPLSTDRLLEALGGLPDAKRHCAALAVQAANLALDQCVRADG
jgi:nitrogen fixation NifU-like protein